MNKMKNFVKEGQKLPLFGIGPYLIYGIALLKAIVLVLTHYVAHIGILNGVWIPIFRIIVAVLIISGLAIWLTCAVRSGMDENIAENKLKTDGIYACVRNPMYTGIWFLMVGISLMWHNCFMIATIPID